ncbi:2-oxoacid:acceptor oxidoreductase family protein [Candidatus Contubernalis alkaliaceticus]|uniref:2-oxoacid:acceptor oxidoreductase family protein n=1 Tax=Candidatus Contubernalis alkaliaceticus TaxID=338645 RepID=UPI001F4BE5F9|nr:2-oxoacid:acceptor oxidoreductase family protein [Candidatus Contubernalis alkalaceticus]UNC91506.1 2-oxoacid:acceptor oxidoreductase family protein [Candidatus Contubernalis alkalaceticus]
MVKEISIHARAGQGAITLAALLGTAVFLEGGYALVFPHFGAARMGAPMNSFVRISGQQIRVRSQVYEPDYIMVVDASLMRGFNVFQGMQEGGVAYINRQSQDGISVPHGVKVYDIPADELSLKIFNRPMGNTVLLGAFSAGTGEVSLDSLEKAVEDKFPEKIVQLNVEAFRAGYEYFKEKFA